MARIASAMVVLPVFLQAPWVRLNPFSATLFTGVLVAAGLVMHQSRSQTTSDLGSLLVGFSGSTTMAAAMRATGKDHDRSGADVCQVPPIKWFL